MDGPLENCLRRVVTVLIVLLLGPATCSFAQQGIARPLFDRFTIYLEGSLVNTNTEIRFDSKEHGLGTTLSFEDDLGLDERKITPALSFEWQAGRRHRLGFRWQKVDRGATAQALDEIEWDGEIIPIGADIDLVYDYETYAVDYTYYPWIKERWAAGFGFGLRGLSILASLSVDGELVGISGSADFTAPLPFFNFEYRRMLSAKWRLKTSFGYFYLSIGDYRGWQQLAVVSFAHQTFKHLGFGAAVNASIVEADVEDQSFFGRIGISIDDVSIFVRVWF